MKNPKMILAIDFDGTIVHDKFPDIGPLKDNVRECFAVLDQYFYILIYSCRSNGLWPELPHRNFRDEMEKFLFLNQIPFDEIYKGNGKPFAVAYLDDKGLRVENNWKELTELLVASVK